MRRILFFLLVAFTFVNVGFSNVFIDNKTTDSSDPFEGIIKYKVTVLGVDLSLLTENIDYSKGDVKGQLSTYMQSIMQENSDFSKKMESNPLLGLVLVFTPPIASIYVKDNQVLANANGLGYTIQHYHDLDKGKFTLKSRNRDDKLTVDYNPSKDFGNLFGDDKLINSDNYTITRSAKSVKVAGHDCNVSTYNFNKVDNKEDSNPLSPKLEIQKFVVYTCKDFSKSINFSHPYYFSEDDGILKIEFYYNNSDEPLMIYEAVQVERRPVSVDMLKIEEFAPVYNMSDSIDLNLSMKILSIVMGVGTVLGE